MLKFSYRFPIKKILSKAQWLPYFAQQIKHKKIQWSRYNSEQTQPTSLYLNKKCVILLCEQPQCR